MRDTLNWPKLLNYVNTLVSAHLESNASNVVKQLITADDFLDKFSIKN